MTSAPFRNRWTVRNQTEFPTGSGSLGMAVCSNFESNHFDVVILQDVGEVPRRARCPMEKALYRYRNHAMVSVTVERFFHGTSRAPRNFADVLRDHHIKMV